MMTIEQFLKDRINQQEARKEMVEWHLNNPGQYLTNKNYTQKDLDETILDIQKCKAALAAAKLITKINR